MVALCRDVSDGGVDLGLRRAIGSLSSRWTQTYRMYIILGVERALAVVDCQRERQRLDVGRKVDVHVHSIDDNSVRRRVLCVHSACTFSRVECAPRSAAARALSARRLRDVHSSAALTRFLVLQICPSSNRDLSRVCIRGT